MEDNNIMVSSDEILRRALQRAEMPPKSIEVHFAYFGTSAAKYNFFNILAQEMFNIDEQEASKYLMRLGVETMRARIAMAYSAVEGIPETTEDDNQAYAD